MATTPTLDTVVAAVVTALAGQGSIVNGYTTLEDEVEVVENGSYISAGSMNLFWVDVRSVEEFEGPASGEIMERYTIEIDYWSLRTGNADWSKEARVKAEAARDALSGAATIFAISSQRQLYTPETVQIDSHGPEEINGTEGPQMVYKTVLSLQVEARRWS
jgi:hypothetical protein